MHKIIFIISVLLPGMLLADVSSRQVNEVKHLLNFVRNSNCLINRNGTDYVGEKAAKHIERKYNYYKADIKTTEMFIELSATKSTTSGNFYMVACTDKKVIKTQKWLLGELARFRAE